MAGDPEEEEDDYLNMTFEDPVNHKKETSLQKTARLKKEAAERGRIPSKAEKQAAADAAREKALATSLDSSGTNKGAKMMAKMGFKPGSALGASGNEGRLNPLEVNVKEGKEGIGIESEKKRKIREQAEAMEQGAKRTKLSEGEFRERNRVEREEKRAEGMWWGGMKVLEGFESEGEAENAEGQDDAANEKNASDAAKRPLKSVNLLWRPLIKTRAEKERDRRARYDLTQSLSRNAEYTSEDADDKLALGTEVEDLEEEDSELDEYVALPAAERLHKVVTYLREKYRYCFWCKYRYEDEEMDGCPGLTEDEHG